MKNLRKMELTILYIDFLVEKLTILSIENKGD